MATEYVTHRDLDALRTEFRGEFALLRGEMMELRGELRGELGRVESRVGRVEGEIAALKTRIYDLPTTRKMWVANATMAIAVAGLVLTSVRFAG